MIDEFFDYELGTLEVPFAPFETEVVDVENYQERKCGSELLKTAKRQHTRIIEH